MPFKHHQPFHRFVENVEDDVEEVNMSFTINPIDWGRNYEVRWNYNRAHLLLRKDVVISLTLPPLPGNWELVAPNNCFSEIVNLFLTKLFSVSKQRLLPISLLCRQFSEMPKIMFSNQNVGDVIGKTYECKCQFANISNLPVEQYMTKEPFYPLLIPNLLDIDGSRFCYVFTDYLFVELSSDAQANEVEKLLISIDLNLRDPSNHAESIEYQYILSGKDAILLEKNDTSYLFAFSWTQTAESRKEVKRYGREIIDWCSRRCEETWSPQDSLSHCNIVVTDYPTRDYITLFSFCWNEDDEDHNLVPEPNIHVLGGFIQTPNQKFKSDLNLAEFFGIE